MKTSINLVLASTFRKLITFSKDIDHICSLLHSQSEVGLHINLIHVVMEGIRKFVILFRTVLKYTFISILNISQQELRPLLWCKLNCALCSELKAASFQKHASYTKTDEEG